MLLFFQQLKIFLFCSWLSYIIKFWKSTITTLGALHAMFFLWLEADSIFSIFSISVCEKIVFHECYLISPASDCS